jgi:hypothetical protein
LKLEGPFSSREDCSLDESAGLRFDLVFLAVLGLNAVTYFWAYF